MNHLAVTVLIALTLSACGATDSGTLGPAPTMRAQPNASPAPPTPSAGPPTAQPTTPAPRTSSPGSSVQPTSRPTSNTQPENPGSPGKVHTFQVWFVRGGKLAVTSRSKPWTPGVAKLAMTSLIAGPSEAEAAAGMRSPIRTGTTFTIVSVVRGVASIELPASFFTGGRTLARQRQAQVVYTLTQYPTISRVEFRINGVGNQPVGRADYADLLPAIVVTMPHIGATVTSPVTVAGNANVYEATVSIRVLNASGTAIATTFTTATCGSGCRGTYSTPVHFTVSRAQPGTIQVYEVSAQDGSRTHVVDIPVTLSP